MNLMLQPEVKPSSTPITYHDKLLLIGSCFSDRIGSRLQEAKFQAVFNPAGIVFDPISLARHLTDYATAKAYTQAEVFQLNELWHSWQHHSDFSGASAAEALYNINEAINRAHIQLKSASFLFMTLGTAYSYQLKDQELPVANCHKAPKSDFRKKLLSVDEITRALRNAMRVVKELNPDIHVVITVSPVKHLRDGLVENMRSKAILLEAAHQLTTTDAGCTYFEAYELVTDVLRDYRFYAQDMAHPNDLAVQFVFEHFCATYLSKETRNLMQEVLQIVSAKNHRALHAFTRAHQQFLASYLVKTTSMQSALPMLNWSEELQYFSNQ